MNACHAIAAAKADRTSNIERPTSNMAGASLYLFYLIVESKNEEVEIVIQNYSFELI